MKIEKIYLDMDGVLADFDRGVSELLGLDPLPQGSKTPDYEDRLWEGVRKEGNFYDKLFPIKGSLEMFRKIREKYGEKCEILTGIPKEHRGIVTAKEDKENWASRLLSKDLKVNTVLRKHKKEYALTPGHILIDDFEKNIKEWREAGGTGILFVSPEDTLKKLKEIEEME